MEWFLFSEKFIELLKIFTEGKDFPFDKISEPPILSYLKLSLLAGNVTDPEIPNFLEEILPAFFSFAGEAVLATNPQIATQLLSYVRKEEIRSALPKGGFDPILCLLPLLVNDDQTDPTAMVSFILEFASWPESSSISFLGKLEDDKFSSYYKEKLLGFLTKFFEDSDRTRKTLVPLCPLSEKVRGIFPFLRDLESRVLAASNPASTEEPATTTSSPP